MRRLNLAKHRMLGMFVSQQFVAKQVCSFIRRMSVLYSFESRPCRACQVCCFRHRAQQDDGCLSVRAAKTSANHIVMRLPPSARIDYVSKLVLVSLSVACQKVLFACHWDVAASPPASRAFVGALPGYSVAKADCKMEMLVPHQIVPDQASVIHKAFTKQVCSSIILGLTRQVRPGRESDLDMEQSRMEGRLPQITL